MLKLLFHLRNLLPVVLLLIVILQASAVHAQDKTTVENVKRVFDNQRFHQQASQKMGLLIPLYILSLIHISEPTRPY